MAAVAVALARLGTRALVEPENRNGAEDGRQDEKKDGS